FTSAYSVKSGLPDWVTSMKFNGDFRGRFEQTSAENPAYVDRNRYRYRLRFGVTATLQDSFEVGFRLASANLITQNSRPPGGNPGVGASHDPYVIGAQLLWEAKWLPKISTALGLSAFTIAGKDALSNTNAPNVNAGNTRIDSGPRFGQLAYNFNPIVVNAS